MINASLILLALIGHDMRPVPCVAALVACLAAAPAAAETRFGIKQIMIDGSAFVQASAINNHNAIAGNYSDGAGVVHGFIQSGTALTVLPPPQSDCINPCPAVPTAINAAGDVVGVYYYGQGYGFLWHNRAYVTAAEVTTGNGGLIGINNRGGEFYNYASHDSNLAYAGKPGAFLPVTPPCSFVIVRSINNAGTVAGDCSPSGPAVFIEKAGVYTTFVPPGAEDAYSGTINDHNQIAGIYQDTQGANNGFVYKAGVFTLFAIPGTHTTTAVHAINNKGRVVGVYTDTKHNEQHAFLFNGKTLAIFGHYGINDAVHVAINDAGVMIVSDYIFSAGVANSFRILCAGDGC